jgi:hypothetical protein
LPMEVVFLRKQASGQLTNTLHTLQQRTIRKGDTDSVLRNNIVSLRINDCDGLRVLPSE